MKTQFRAEWYVGVLGEATESRTFSSQQDAIDHAHKHDLYGRGKVFVQQSTRDDTQEIFILEDGTTEIVGIE